MTDTKNLSIAALLDGVDAVLFDMDGVLLDTEPLYTQGTREILGERADDFTWEVKKKLMGRAPLESATILVNELKLPYSPEEYLKKKKPALMKLFPRTPAKPGAPELVQEFKSRQLPLAVATSSDRVYFEAKTGHHDWFSLFDAVVCGSDPEVKNYKPQPDIFIEAARRIGHAPERCLIIEDSVAGVQAAVASGAARVLAIIDDQQSPSAVDIAHHVIRRFEQIER